ncbi:MAG: HD domain-containing protein [Planctomycetota bacterium]
MTAGLPEPARHFARAVQEAGGRAFLVGGFPRDHLLGLESKDLDMEVYGLPPDRLQALLKSLGKVNNVGEAFTVSKLRLGEAEIDVALPRRDSKVGSGHKGFAIQGDPDLPIEEAVRRRDFTINAMMLDPLTGELLDPSGGREDLDRRVLRVVDEEHFGEDSLRVLRAMQFAGRFELRIDTRSLAVCGVIDLDDLPPERVFWEFEKLLLQAKAPSVGLRAGRELSVFKKLFPEIEALVGCEQDAEFHPEGDVWIHTCMVVDEAAKDLDGLTHAEQLTVMLACLCHDLGKPATTAIIEGRIRSPNHEPEGLPPTERVLDGMNVHSFGGFDVRREVLALVGHHLKPGQFFYSKDDVGDGAFRRLALKCDPELLTRVARADDCGRGGHRTGEAADWFLARMKALAVADAKPEPILMGRHLIELGMTPGKQMGDVLSAVFEKQLDGEITTLEEAIREAKRLIG